MVRSRVARWFDRHPVPLLVRALEASVKLINVLLAVVGALMVAYSAYSLANLPPGLGPAPAPASQPAPQPGGPDSMWVPAGGAPLQQQQGTAGQSPWPAQPTGEHAGQASKPSRHLLAHTAGDRQDAAMVAALRAQAWLAQQAEQGMPWFLYAFGATGLATLLTACTALIGTSLRSPGCLGTNVFMMCLLLTGQACLAVAFFVDTSWERLLPPETSGDYEVVKAFITGRLQVCKWVGVGVFLGQLLATLCSCALQSLYTMADEAAEDEEQEDDGSGGRRTPLLVGQQAASGPTAGRRPSLAARREAGACRAEAPVLPPPTQRDDSWSQRMQQQYGLDTGVFTYDPTSRGRAPQPAQQQPQGSKCVVM